MEMALFYVLAALVLNVKVTLQQVSLYPGAKNIKIANLFRLRGYRLDVSPLASLELGNEMQCLTLCVKTDDCYCVNIKKQVNENVMCELLNRTMYQYPGNLTQKEGISHWYTKVTSCVPDPCKIYAACITKDSVRVPFACIYKADYNFALLKRTAQSDTRFHSGSDLSSHYAVDGIKAHSCLPSGVPSCAHLDTGHNQWWRVDLQITIPVSCVGITNRKLWWNGLNNFEIKIGNSLENEGRDNPKCGDRHSVPFKEAKLISCLPPLRGRYVVIQGFDSQYPLVLIEVEVFAAEVEVKQWITS